MPLKPGRYQIRSKLNDLQVYRDISSEAAYPVRVVTIFESIIPVKWDAELLPNGNNILKIENTPDPAVDIDDLVFVTTYGKPATEWRIEPQFHQGENLYTIFEAAKHGEGWLVPDKNPETQVAVRPLPATKSLPPQYFDGALFVITQ